MRAEQKHRRKYDTLPELPENKPTMLLGCFYSGEEKTAYLRFYNAEDSMIYFWRDRTKHLPFCFTRIEFEDQVKTLVEVENKFSVQRVTRIDVLHDKEIDMLKIIAPDPLSIGGAGHGFREKIPTYESDIKYHETYLYDKGLIVGAYYVRKGDKIDYYEYPISDNVQLALKTLLWDKILESTGESGREYRNYITRWANLLNQPVANLKRLAIDIEVETEEGRMPNPNDHNQRITAIGMVGSDGYRMVLTLADIESNGQELIPEAELFATEKEMLEKAFKVMREYPVILTFNGDDFDMPYLYFRAQDPRIDPVNKISITRDNIPIIVKKETYSKQMQSDPVGIYHGIHIDLYRVFQNRSIQIYAFSRAYIEHTLNAVSEALLNDSKFEFEGNISDLPVQTLAIYCLKDADLTYRLTSFNDNLLIKLLIIIARIGRLSIDDIARTGVNQWTRGILYFEHRRRMELIPSKRELEAKGQGTASTEAVIKEKKYRGAIVIEPVSGVHFNVVVVDYASLYPSIVKVRNLSYETINCQHDDCRSNVIEGTAHWVCKKRNGLAALIIGSLRDLRVSYYKHLAKDKSLPADERQLYNVISQACKVILNASYGVLGFESFPLYCLPVAEAVTAVGRATIDKTAEKAKEQSILVVAGDTDSLFLKNPSKDAIEIMIKWAQESFGITLEVDKEYKYAVFSKLKKNYLGIRQDGTADVKGLTGKKSQTPPFIKNTFYQILDILGKVNNEPDFIGAKQKIIEIIQNDVQRLMNGKIPLEEMSFTVAINKPLKSYGAVKNNKKIGEPESNKGLPQHIKAAKMLADYTKRELVAGDRISYIKTNTSDGVKPVEIASVNDVDIEKYLESMESVFEQILSVLDFDFKSVLGKPKEEPISSVFWS